ncbi:hypothetical protein [Methylobacterium radiodurans]|uniref:Uncharacterized protein n=1 Tax=Methylobacterium radiodurans TaxID=2202828 RepID=A0A2U8VWL4_9HYPH|nr:hypothetical protein [Methylobacterium radiodurans]AWN37680.1 hypothetical protein DK427_19725 [Methylobacterium radiodurans]
MPSDRAVLVKHPAPMLLRRKRKRKREHWFAAMTTPVVLRVGSTEDLGETHVDHATGRPLVWRVFEGALWYQVSGMPVGSVIPGPWKTFGPAEFEAFLAGERFARDPAHTDLGHVTRRTPLAAATHDEWKWTRGTDIEGGDRPPSEIEVSEIHEDGRASAAEDLRRFMDERVRIVGDVVLIRAYDPLATPGAAGWRLQPFPQGRDTSPRLVHIREPLGYRPDAYRQGIAWEFGTPQVGHVIGVGPWAGSFAGATYGTDTARLLAGLAASAAMETFRQLRTVHGRLLAERIDADTLEVLESLARETQSWAEKASLGRIIPEEAPGAVDAARRLTRVVADCHGAHAVGTAAVHEAEFLIRRFEEFEWPLTGLDVPGPDDLTSLAALAR